MKPRIDRACLLAACLASAACGDLRVRSVRVTDGVPASLEGEWRGTWTSSTGSGSGEVLIQVQEFQQQPLVTVTIDNPDFVARDYQLVLAGGRIELRLDGATVLAADLQPNRVLLGSYDTGEDTGTWSAAWQRQLPTPVDLSGTWSGTVGIPGVDEEPLTMTLSQTVRSGQLVLEGQVELPAALPVPVPVSGYVQFVGEGFEFALLTATGFEPEVLMTAAGDRNALFVPVGLLQVLGATPLPFSQAVFQVRKDP